MRLHRARLVAVSFVALAVNGMADSSAERQMYVDKVYQITFRYPKDWKVDPSVPYAHGDDGYVKITASGGDTPRQVCQGQAQHKARPFGTHPTIRSLTVQGQPACLVWPSKDQ